MANLLSPTVGEGARGEEEAAGAGVHDLDEKQSMLKLFFMQISGELEEREYDEEGAGEAEEYTSCTPKSLTPPPPPPLGFWVVQVLEL